MMEFVNGWEKTARDSGETALRKEDVLVFAKMLAPFAPFIADELYAQFTGTKSTAQYEGVHVQSWPSYSAELARQETVTIAVQVDGKLRGQVTVEQTGIDNTANVLAAAKQAEGVQKWLKDKQVVKEIYVPGRIVSFVTK
jgi:leucyl-tRNA synthetase